MDGNGLKDEQVPYEAYKKGSCSRKGYKTRGIRMMNEMESGMFACDIANQRPLRSKPISKHDHGYHTKHLSNHRTIQTRSKFLNT